ncbi:class I SAM-dependent methyltransferase [Eubacterium sp. AM05-23]|nr:class I SAM-dependent methyltransferase [Eubacterium sp. AM05-23]
MYKGEKVNSTLKSSEKNWYKEIWSLDIKNQSWVENTVDKVAFIIKTLKLNGTEKILDMACGFGRHSLEFARRGYEVVGVDITKDYVDDAIKSADHEKLKEECAS